MMTSMSQDSRTIGYRVIDIATPRADLLCWEKDTDPAPVMRKARQLHISYLPVQEGKTFIGIITAGSNDSSSPEILPLTIDWCVAADTPILHLIELFAYNPNRVYLVLQSSSLVGLVAPADLNKIPARASLYLLTAQFEAELVNLLTRLLPDEEDYIRHLGADTQTDLRQIQGQAKDKDINLPLINYMSLSNLMTIVAKEENLYTIFGFPPGSATHRIKDDLHPLVDLRNDISHITKSLVASRDQLPHINEICGNLIRYSDAIRQKIRSLDDTFDDV